MKSDKGQSYLLIGIGLFMLATVVLYVGISQPRLVVENKNVSAVSQTTTLGSKENSKKTVSSQNNKSSVVKNNSVSEKHINYPLNLNTATVEDLMSVDGIGESRAWQIVSYRNEIGKYTSVEEIKNISGIGDGVFEKIAPYLTV